MKEPVTIDGVKYVPEVKTDANYIGVKHVCDKWEG